MSLKYLLDTNIISNPLRPQPSLGVLSNLKQYGQAVAIATVVWHELLYGLHRLPPSARKKAIAQYLDQVIAPNMPILPYDTPAAQWHATERARLVSQGQTPAFADGQIAAIAKVNDLILVTANTADFKLFEGLKIENWFT